jgi:hypothetical protein
MSSCILHIGMHKTGSTSIQNSLHGIEDKRFLCAKLGEDVNHSLAIYSIFASHPERHHMHKVLGLGINAVRDYIASMRLDLERSIAVSKDRTLIISGEDITALEEGELKVLRDFLCARMDGVTVVGYVRSPAEYMASAFQERVRSGSLSTLVLGRQYRSYRKTFEKFDRVFGRENVHLWKFDPAHISQELCGKGFLPEIGYQSASIPNQAGKRIGGARSCLPHVYLSKVWQEIRIG